MIKLEDKQNVEPVSAEYPYGNIKDDTGTGNGTPVNTAVYADIHQFFARMADQSGITINDLPDNATNGFQLFEALLASNVLGLKTGWSSEVTISTSNLKSPGRTFVLSTSKYKYKVFGKTLMILIDLTGVASAGPVADIYLDVEDTIAEKLKGSYLQIVQIFNGLVFRAISGDENPDFPTRKAIKIENIIGGDGVNDTQFAVHGSYVFEIE